VSVAERLTVLVGGMVAGVPGQGGATWATLQYVLGLRRLGHEVWLVEPVSRLDEPITAYFDAVTARFALRSSSALLVDGPARRTHGASYAALQAAAGRAHLVVNLSGMLRDPELLGPAPRRLYVDLDPAFTQAWAADGIDVGLDGHTDFATVGLAVGRSGCAVPTLGRRWIHTVPPVVLDEWAADEPPTRNAFTTVGNWRSYGTATLGGIALGQRAHSVRALLGLGRSAAAPLEVALAIHPDERHDLQALRDAGWTLLDPARVAGTPDAYRQFVRRSLGELGIAKHGYVASGSGWFSDRSACYLAAGRPVLAQDSGWSDHLPAGVGLLAFTDQAEAAEKTFAIVGDYARHAAAARHLALETFDARRVLGRLLETVGVGA
jgi:hypothetical protein